MRKRIVRIDFTGVKRPRGRPEHLGSTKQTQQGALMRWAMKLFHHVKKQLKGSSKQKTAAKVVAEYLVTNHADYVTKYLKLEGENAQTKLETMILHRRTDQSYLPTA